MSNSTITKEKIAQSLNRKLGFSVAICEDIITSLFEEAELLLIRDKKLMLNKFGTWRTSIKKERPGFDIHKEKSMQISSRKVLQFSSSNILRDKLNGY